MATRGELFPSKWLAKEDVPKPTNVTIVKVETEDVGSEEDSEEKRVLFFEDPDRDIPEKQMVLNITNWEAIADITGEGDDDNWSGHRVCIYIDRNVTYKGKRTGGLRIREPGDVDEPAPRPKPSKARKSKEDREASKEDLAELIGLSKQRCRELGIDPEDESNPASHLREAVKAFMGLDGKPIPKPAVQSIKNAIARCHNDDGVFRVPEPDSEEMGGVF